MNGEQNSATETPTSFLDRLRECTTGEQVVLYRAGGRELEFIDRYSAASIAASTEADIMADVKAEHGGGSYELRLLRSNGQIGGRHTFSIAGLPKRPTEEKPAANNGGELAAVLASIQQSNQQTQQLLLAGLEKIGAALSAPKEDTFAQFERFAGVMGKFGGTPKPEKSLGETIGELVALKEVVPGLFGDGGGSGGDSWASLLNMAGPLMQLAQQPAAQAPAPTAPTPRPRALPKPQGTRTVPEGMTEAELAQYRANVAQLVTLASTGTAPATVAQLIVAQSPDRAQLAQLVAADPVPWLAQFDDRVTQHAGWFRALGQQITGLIDEPIPALDGASAARASPDTARAGRGRHPADAQDHGATGAPGPRASGRPRARRATGAAPAAEGVSG